MFDLIKFYYIFGCSFRNCFGYKIKYYFCNYKLFYNFFAMDDRQTIGENFRRYIKSRGLNQREAADRIGISPPHLANLLNGKEKIGYNVAHKMADAFPEIDAGYLMTGEGVLVPPPGTVRISQAQRVGTGGTGIQAIGADQALALENTQLRRQLDEARAEKDRLLGIIETLTRK